MPVSAKRVILIVLPEKPVETVCGFAYAFDVEERILRRVFTGSIGPRACWAARSFSLFRRSFLAFRETEWEGALGTMVGVEGGSEVSEEGSRLSAEASCTVNVSGAGSMIGELSGLASGDASSS